ncbi:DUF2975 domain-containing protein [Arthrobacter livingstonensis]|uniref:DUF2975 domain-containing protein n=1 Tax=Arthrobacter livingstonensis TaxID=670078 RepID=A0A2V5LTF9_9MICC|nr:DUF2975 domain-containing protein [Arthrobacter livingstonensis]PYI66497.1 DUF2975 domain-containing protein [Arthrobacter livingstonensis]
MRRETSFVLIAVLFVLLTLSVFAQVWVLPTEVGNVIDVFPEVQPVAVPSVVWGVLAIVCWQGIAVIGLRLVALARDHKFEASAKGWIHAIIGCLLVFIVLVVSAFIALIMMGYATPGVMLGLMGGGILAVVAVVSLVAFLGNRRYQYLAG